MSVLMSPLYDGLTVIPAIVLAAGKSTRMGQLKALLPAGPGDSFLTRIVRTFHSAGVERVVVVLGHEAGQLRAHLREHAVNAEVVINAGYEAGQLSSLLVGLDAIASPGAGTVDQVEAVLLMLVDAPFVSSETVRQVLARYRDTHAPVVRPVQGMQHGHPVLIDRSLFPLLRAADPLQGAKPIVRAHVSAAGDVTVEDPGAFMDIDTPEEFVRATS